MKSISTIVLSLFLAMNVSAQDEMKHFGKKIYVDNVPVTLNTAAFMAFEVSTSSYNHIKTAQRGKQSDPKQKRDGDTCTLDQLHGLPRELTQEIFQVCSRHVWQLI